MGNRRTMMPMAMAIFCFKFCPWVMGRWSHACGIAYTNRTVTNTRISSPKTKRCDTDSGHVSPSTSLMTSSPALAAGTGQRQIQAAAAAARRTAAHYDHYD